MYLIAGLGNPEKKYENTRHNIGFDAIDALAAKYNITCGEKKFRGLWGTGFIQGQKVMLLKPQTYMNLSGESIGSAVNYYGLDPAEQVLVLCDDVHLSEGQLRIRKKGSAGGHNGLKNIIAHLQGEEFSRIRIGVGEKPEQYDMADYVLGHFTSGQRGVMDQAVQDAVRAVEMILSQGMEAAMNAFNRKQVQ